MVFGGFQKLTLLDYPSKVAAILFTKGCNFKCPFCHNAVFVNKLNESETYTEEYILDYLKKRKGILDGLCISGGEPLLNDEIFEFIKKVKDIGYSIKLDTNGSFPDKLKLLINNKLIDYVAMDFKNSLDKYPLTIGCNNINIDDVIKSIDLLLEEKIDYEFRTTVTDNFHTPFDIEKICQKIKGAKKYFLQNFVDSGNIIGENIRPVSKDNLNEMLLCAKKFVKNAQIRG